MLDDISCPVLVVHGELDPFFSLGHSQDIVDRLSDGRLVCIPRANHSIHQHHEGEFNVLVSAFLADCWTRNHGNSKL